MLEITDEIAHYDWDDRHFFKSIPSFEDDFYEHDTFSDDSLNDDQEDV
jgi:hypothetical protein